MNARLQAQLERVDTALNTLLDSISSYSPSPPAAAALIEADDELSKGLRDLAKHQSNYARIMHLQSLSSSLSDQLTQTLTSLVKTREELLTLPTASPSPNRNQTPKIPYLDLLAYAKKISKFTVPPTYRPTQQEMTRPSASSPPTTTTEEQPPNGTSPATKGTGVGVASLPPQDADWLDQMRRLPFVPWPSDDSIRRGALAEIQSLLDAGQEIPAGGAQTQVKQQEAPHEGREAVVEPARPTAAAAAAAGAGVSAPREPVKQEKEKEKPSVFGGLDLYDPEDD